MKKSKSVIRSWAVAAAMIMVLAGANLAGAASIPQEVEELRMKYERLYQQYTQALSDAKNSTAAELGKEVEVAKRRYEEARKALTPSQKTQEKIKETAEKVKTTVDKLFSTGDRNETPTAVASKELPGYSDFKISIDGDNYCGQFAMTSVFNGMGIAKDPQKIYQDTNPAGIFTGPPTIVEYLNMNGIDASQKHNASLGDLTRKIDAGLPVIVLMNSGGGVPHWVNVYGYNTDAEGKVVSLKLRDSYWGTSKGYEMDVERFKTAWNDPVGTKLPNSLLGYSNLMIDIKGTREPAQSPSALNFNFNTAMEDNMSSGINDVVTGFKRIAPMQLAGGITKCVLGIPGTVLGVTAKGINKLGDMTVDWGKSRLDKGGFGNTLLGGTAVVGGSVVKAVGYVAKASGNLLSGVATMAGNFTKKLGYVFAR